MLSCENHSRACYNHAGLSNSSEMNKVIVQVSSSSPAQSTQELGYEKKHDKWSDLPCELLSLILRNAHYKDYYKFRATCTSWQSVTPSMKLTPDYPYYQSPCLLRHGVSGIHAFLNPVYNITYLTRGLESCETILYSFNHGWMLMGIQNSDHIFFWDPFAKVKISIPDMPPKSKFQNIFFSSAPTSPNCVVIALFALFGFVDFGIIRRGEENWTVDEFKSSPMWLKFQLSHCNPIFYKGQYYCLDKNGHLGVFGPQDVADTFHIYRQHLPKKITSTTYRSYKVESNGEILSVIIYGGGHRHVCIYKLDDSKMTWERVEDLGNTTLFISDIRSFSTTSTIQGMGNRIYLPVLNDKDGVFYSLATKRYHSYANDSCETPHADLKEWKDFPEATWVPPEFASSQPDDFKW